MPNKQSILITGANRGIGLELVKESLNKNAFVIGTFRNKLKSLPNPLEIILFLIF